MWVCVPKADAKKPVPRKKRASSIKLTCEDWRYLQGSATSSNANDITVFVTLGEGRY